MSDSEELLFGNITNADDDDSDHNHDGTQYPKHMTTVAMDSDESDSYNPTHSRSAIQIKQKSKSNKLKRDKSRKRIKDIAMNATATNTQTNTGEIGSDLVDIDPSSPIRSNHKKKSKKKKKHKTGHTIISDKDSEDEYSDDSETYMSQDSDTHNTHTMHTRLFSVKQLQKNGHLCSLALTLIVIIALLSCISRSLIAVIIFLTFYTIYLIECYVNKTWKQMHSDKDISDGSVKLLDAMRKTPPIIDWSIECYHWETTNIPPKDKKTIVWVGGKPENEHSFEELGFVTQSFKWDWNGIEFVANKDNHRDIAGIIVPSGYEGNRIQKSMMDKFGGECVENDEKVAIQIDEDETDMDLEMSEWNESGFPKFFRWNGDMSALLKEFKDANVIREEKKKRVTHTNSMTYDYNNWNDISVDYPDLNRFEITKLHISKTYCLLNEETRNDFNEQKQEFLDLNNKDEFQSFDEKIDVRGFKHCVTIKKNDDLKGGNNVKKPFWYTVHGYWIFSVFFCTLYPRYKCCTMFGTTNWKLIKAISI